MNPKELLEEITSFVNENMEYKDCATLNFISHYNNWTGKENGKVIRNISLYANATIYDTEIWIYATIKENREHLIPVYSYSLNFEGYKGEKYDLYYVICADIIKQIANIKIHEFMGFVIDNAPVEKTITIVLPESKYKVVVPDNKDSIINSNERMNKSEPVYSTKFVDFIDKIMFKTEHNIETNSIRVVTNRSDIRKILNDLSDNDINYLLKALEDK